MWIRYIESPACQAKNANFRIRSAGLFSARAREAFRKSVFAGCRTRKSRFEDTGKIAAVIFTPDLRC